MGGGADGEGSCITFPGLDGGVTPFASLTFDGSGNLDGTGLRGGLYGWGLVFELSPAANGTWSEKVLHSFDPTNGRDGGRPCSELVLLSNNLARRGVSGTYQEGTVFRVTPRADGWAETVLYEFDTASGVQPFAGVTLDRNGNLYGVTSRGGPGESGTAFELTANNEGAFHGGTVSNGKDGSFQSTSQRWTRPEISMAQPALEEVLAWGTVFELMPRAEGGWMEKILHTFAGTESHHGDGWCPVAGVVFDDKGNLYGTTEFGGNGENCSIVYELSPLNAGGWRESIIHDFVDNSPDGCLPVGQLAVDGSGNLYGTTNGGGTYAYGTVYELTPSATGWSESILHSFNNDGVDGYGPYGGVILDGIGNLYGTTTAGGALGGGTVYEITP